MGFFNVSDGYTLIGSSQKAADVTRALRPNSRDVSNNAILHRVSLLAVSVSSRSLWEVRSCPD